MTEPFDPGLQPERTELAWRRTALAIAVGSLVALRVLPSALGSPWWVLVGVGGLFVAGTLWGHARRRLAFVNAMLERDGDRAALPGAGPLAVLAFVVIALGVLAVVATVLD